MNSLKVQGKLILSSTACKIRLEINSVLKVSSSDVCPEVKKMKQGFYQIKMAAAAAVKSF